MFPCCKDTVSVGGLRKLHSASETHMELSGGSLTLAGQGSLGSGEGDRAHASCVSPALSRFFLASHVVLPVSLFIMSTSVNFRRGD